MNDSAPQVDHVTINMHDLPAAQRFYATVLGTLGLAERIGFVAPSREAVDAFYEAALAAGGRSLAEPRDRPEFGSGCYNCYVEDTEGNGLEAAYRPPPSAKPD
jgi:catechol 2,3-dioxygenase-like lactoylglutathione lyase family enzyme